MQVSPALSAKLKKGKKHTANGHLRGNGANYPMGKIFFRTHALVVFHSLIRLKYFWLIFMYHIGPHTFDIEEEVEEDEDFLAASWASSKTVCSDAFDFLFDEKNMNPENVLEKHPDVIEIKPDKDFGKPIMDSQHSKCCVIS